MMQTSPVGKRDMANTLEFSLSPRALRHQASESFAPFTFIPNAKIPDLSDTRREQREERFANLMKRPKHKQKFVGKFSEIPLSQSDKLMSAPLTMEDKN